MDTLKNDRGIHLRHPFYDCTLCGDSWDGGIDLSEHSPTQIVNESVTCSQCLQIIRACVEYDREICAAKLPRIPLCTKDVKIRVTKIEKGKP